VSVRRISTYYFDCDCTEFGHVFRVVYDELTQDMWIEVQLRHVGVWYKRLWIAVRYVFGLDVPYGFYDVVLLNSEQVKRLMALLARKVSAEQQQLWNELDEFVGTAEPPEGW
jgi:hypothetical protein